jgi:hypothetical protein
MPQIAHWPRCAVKMARLLDRSESAQRLTASGIDLVIKNFASQSAALAQGLDTPVLKDAAGLLEA